MKVELKSIHNTFFFIEDVCLVKHEAPKEIDLDGKSDGFLQSIILGASSGLIGCSVPNEKLIKLIKNKLVRDNLKNVIGLKVDDEPVFEDVISAPVEVVDVKIEESTDDEDDIVEPQEPKLEDILDGAPKVVATKIKAAALSDEQKLILLDLEEKGKNRAVVISALSA
jgi:hypothetical protein